MDKWEKIKIDILIKYDENIIDMIMKGKKIEKVENLA